MNCLLLCFFLFFATTVISAQQPPVELNPVTVSASLHPLPSSKTGRNIISIPGDNFVNLPVHSLDELLRYVPGIEVQMRGPQGSQSDIVIRGGTFQQVLVILDGIRLNDPNTGHFNSYIPIAPSEIERIEILKGASSAVYGTEAVGGVINIITKSFSSKRNATLKQISGSFVAGEYNLINGSAGVNLQKNNTAFSAGVMTNNSNGQIQRGTRGSFNNLTASVSVRHFINDKWSFALRSSYDQRKFGAQNFYTTFLSDTANEKVAGLWNHANLSFSEGRHRLTFDAGFKAVDDTYQFNPSSLVNKNRSRLLQFLLVDHFQVSTNAILTTGVQYQQKSIRSNDRGNHSLPQMAAFILLNHEWGKFTYSPAIRIDYSKRRGTELVPQINLSYHLPKWQFRASAGKTIRDADFTERFNNYSKTLVTGGSVGNPDLEAERSFSYEFGVDVFAGKHLKISTTVFQRLQSELIDWVTTPYSEMPRKENLSPTGTFALAKNIAEVNTSGLEADFQYTRNFRKDQRVISNIGIIWLDNQTMNVQPSFYLSSHAKFMTNFNFIYSNRIFAVSLNGLYKYRQAQSSPAINAKLSRDYLLLNARGTVYFAKRRGALFFEIDNLTNIAYSDLLGSKMPNSWCLAGISFSF